MRSLLFGLAFWSPIAVPDRPVPAPPLAVHHFGISLTTGAGSQLFTCFLVKEFEGRIVQADPITRDEFTWQIQGVLPSKANPEGADLFAQHGIEACSAVTDTLGRRYGTFCPMMDDLWKLRFWEYPFTPVEGAAAHPGKGWSEKPNTPSERQLLLLSDYGFRYVGDICYGENMFRLLKDMGEPAWVDSYRQGY